MASKRDKVIVNVDMASAFTVNSILPIARIALAERGSDVANELAIIAGLSQSHVNRCSITFGMYSPQADFVPNYRLVSPMNAYLISGGNDTSVMQAIALEVGYAMLRKNSVDSKHVGTLALAHHIVNGTMPTFAELLATPGAKEKVASMITALHNQYARVMTLDTWMLGGLITGNVCYTKRQERNYTYHNAATYHAIANTLLAVADELHVSPFMLQWSLWCYFRGNKHETHLPIFGLGE